MREIQQDLDNVRHYWFYIIKKLLYNYPEGLLKDDSQMSRQALKAISEALEETESLDCGPLRIKLIELVYFRQTKNFQGAALSLYISDRTAARWNKQFIYLVAKKLGFR